MRTKQRKAVRALQTRRGHLCFLSEAERAVPVNVNASLMFRVRVEVRFWRRPVTDRSKDLSWALTHQVSVPGLPERGRWLCAPSPRRGTAEVLQVAIHRKWRGFGCPLPPNTHRFVWVPQKFDLNLKIFILTNILN